MPLYKWHTFWMAQCLICYFIGIFFYIEGKGLLMRNLATILHLRPNLLRLWTKVSLCRHTEIYRHLVSKGFKYAILKRQEMVHCNFFIWHQTKKSLLENLYREAGFWLCCGKHIIFNIKWFEVHKISERYGANLYYKTSDLFPLVFLGLVTFS